MKKLWVIFGSLTFVSLSWITAAEIRHVCVTNPYGRGDSYGDSDPYDGGDYRERDNYGGGMYPPTGTLTCSHMNGGSILVKKVLYGISIYPGTCQPDGYCGEEFETGNTIAGRCDGQPSCTVDLRYPGYLKCGQPSAYLRVEYECINSWATYDVCNNASMVAREPSAYITSPGYMGGSAIPPSRGTKMCECIIRSQDGADLYLNYLETKLSSDRQTCPYEYVLLQNKENITRATIDNEMEVCGHRTISGRWFKGTLRIILASGGPVEKQGMIAKITADNLGNPPRLDIECGTVPNNDLKLQRRPVLRETVAGPVTRTRIGQAPMGGPAGGAPYPGSGAPYPPVGPGGPPVNPGGYHHNRRPMHDDDGPYDDMNEQPEYGDSNYPHHRQSYPPPGAHYPPQGPNYPPPGPNYPQPGPNYPPAGPNYPPYHPAPVQPPVPPPGPLKTRINIPDLPPIDRRPDLPTGSPPLRNGFQPDISRLRVKIAGTDQPPAHLQPMSKFNPVPKRKPQPIDQVPKRKPKPAPPKNQGPKPRNNGPGNKRPKQQVRNAPNKNGAGKIVDDQSGKKSTPLKKSGNGNLVALVFGAIGSALILGSVAILALHNYRKRQRIKREEAEYAYSGGSSSSYGRGWAKEEMVIPEESIYSTVAEVDMYRNASVNPSGSAIEEAAPSEISNKRRRRNDIDMAVATGRLQHFAYDGPASSRRKSVDDIAVIDIHRAFDDKMGCSSEDHRHDTDCLRNFGYTGVEKVDEENSPYCKTCQIRPPPRRKDRNGGYDNNVSVRKEKK